MQPRKQTTYPIVTGASVLGIKYKDGIMIACDTLCSYGSTARYKEVCRMAKVGTSTIIGASGEYSDFQHWQNKLNELDDEEWSHDDGIRMGPKQIHAYCSCIMHQRRNKVNPLWNQLVIGGVKNGNKFLGYVDLYGTTYEEDYIATGFGAHIALPLLREQWKPDMTEQQARDLMVSCLRVCFYRDCRSSNRVQFSKSTDTELVIEEPFSMDTYWGFEKWMKSTTNQIATGGSW